MQDNASAPQLDPSKFAISSVDALQVNMPPAPVVTEDDIDAQLFVYVASAEKGSGIHSVADLDDAWVKSSFDGLDTIAALREAISRDIGQQGRRIWDNLKFQKCSDALAARFEGEVPEDVVEANAEASRAQYDQRLMALGTTKARYLRDQQMTLEEFDEKLHDDVVFQLKLNGALDKMIEATGTEVAKSELTEYLSTDDPDAFLAQLEETGRVEDARQAAARVKVMRHLVATAVVTEVNEDATNV